MSDVEFYFGLLYGLRLAGVTKFDSSGDCYHKAFGDLVKTVKRAGGEHPNGRWFGGRDPMFGTYREASELVSWGMHGGMLTLDSPGYRTARLCVSVRAANRWFVKHDHGVWFRQLGCVFADALERRGAWYPEQGA